MTTQQKVVVTGIGMLSALGGTKEETFAGLLAGRSGVVAAPAPVVAMMPNALAAVAAGFEHRLSRAELALDRATGMALLVVREALADANFSPTDEQKRTVGVYAGIGMGGAQTLDVIYKNYYENLAQRRSEGRDPCLVHPLTVARVMSNAPASAISIEHGFRGPTHNYSVACASSAIAIGEAYRAIQSGRVDTVIVVGAEAMLVAGPFMGWNAMRVLATPRDDDPATSCRPFDRERSGFALGEGAAALVLERENVARERGAQIYGRICGYGSSSDATHLTMPSEDGQVAAIREAIDESGLPADAIGYVNAHGTATNAGDIVETNSIRTAFGPHAQALAISSTKSMHGHLIGACGALEFGISLMALRSGSVPPTAHLLQPDERCDLDYVPRIARHDCNLQAVMSNTFAFGGSNVSLVASRAVSL